MIHVNDDTTAVTLTRPNPSHIHTYIHTSSSSSSSSSIALFFLTCSDTIDTQRHMITNEIKIAPYKITHRSSQIKLETYILQRKMNQSIHPSIHSPTNHSTNQPINQSNRSIITSLIITSHHLTDELTDRIDPPGCRVGGDGYGHHRCYIAEHIVQVILC